MESQFYVIGNHWKIFCRCGHTFFWHFFYCKAKNISSYMGTCYFLIFALKKRIGTVSSKPRCGTEKWTRSEFEIARNWKHFPFFVKVQRANIFFFYTKQTNGAELTTLELIFNAIGELFELFIHFYIGKSNFIAFFHA